MRHKRYFYGLMARYIGYFVADATRVVEIGPRSRLLGDALARPLQVVAPEHAVSSDDVVTTFQELETNPPDRVILNGSLHFTDDIQELFDRVRRVCRPDTRIIITYFSALWKPLFQLAARVGLADTGKRQNWLTSSDVRNFLTLSGFEAIGHGERVLLPIGIPLISRAVNRWLAPLPVFRLFAVANVLIARPVPGRLPGTPSVSVVVPARNERGTIEALVRRLPVMGPADELILVEGHSSDGTWDEMKRVAAAYPARRIQCLQQSGRGKGDAVRLGFAHARCEVLMILDADLSVPPEVLPRFYRAVVDGFGELVNGSRLVYPMEERAMRFWNLAGNKFFAAAFSYLLGQSLKDTLCGTKALRRSDYETIARNRAYFGEFDPFGDFDLLFGAARQALKIVELPIRYRERVYGETNIRRWAHGWLLIRMTAFAARRMKFI